MHDKTGRREKKWVLRDRSAEEMAVAASIAEALKLNPVLARLLVNRGCDTPEAAQSFLRLENEMLGDPFRLLDMQKAVCRISDALSRHEKIMVYGDYDVDGVTSVCTLLLYLRSKGADASYYIPNRIGDGYGVSAAAVERFAEEGVSLVITVDTGITANREVELAKSFGMDFVITDHHECHAELPLSVAVVNPHRPDCPYPFKELAGVGVVFKLICALEQSLTGDEMIPSVLRICEQYADLISIGTIADVMPILDENKLIVRYGLRMIGETKRPGLKALLNAVSAGSENRSSQKKPRQKITSTFVGYTLAPKINAVGRVRSASIAVDLFLSENEKDADELAQILCEANKERQAEENRIMQEAFLQVEDRQEGGLGPVIILDSDEWHHGVIGIVSSRVTEKYGLPSILVSFEGCDPVAHSPEDIGKGSGRSIDGFNLMDALMQCNECLVKFGGHALAAGLSVKRGMLDTFRDKINAYAKTVLSDEELIPTLEADCELSPSEMTMDLASSLSMMEPFGVGNPVPVFVLRSAAVLEIVPVSGGKHTRLLISADGISYQAMCFGFSSSELGFFVGDTVDLMFTLDINEWRGRRSLQLIVKDLRESGQADSVREDERARFDAIWNGSSFLAEENVLPVREEFVAVYTILRQSLRMGVDCISHRVVLSRLFAVCPGRIGYVKLRVILAILEERGLLITEEISRETYRFRFPISDGKTDLEQSPIFTRMRAQERKK